MLKIAKTDMRNIKYALQLFIDIAGNIDQKKWYGKPEIQYFWYKKYEIKNI